MSPSLGGTTVVNPVWPLVRAIAVIGGFITFIGWIVGVFYPPKEALLLTLLVVSLVSATGGVVTIWRTRTELSTGRFAFTTASLVLSLLVSGAFGYRLAVPPVLRQGEPSAFASTQLHFQTHPGMLKGCDDLHGTGTLPPDSMLLIFVQGVDKTGQPTGAHYLQTAATPENDGWLVHNLQAGNPHTQIKLEAIPVSKQVGESFLSIHVYHNTDPRNDLTNVSLRMSKLPAEPADSMVLTRDSTQLGCQ